MAMGQSLLPPPGDPWWRSTTGERFIASYSPDWAQKFRNWDLVAANETNGYPSAQKKAPESAPAQAPKPDPAKPPEMTDGEKFEIRDAQNKYLQILLRMAEAEKQYTALLQSKNTAQDQMNQAQAAVQKRIGDDWTINPETLGIAAAPKPPAAAPAPAPAKNN